MPERLGARLTGRLGLLAAAMRAGGARIGMDELLAAHRALHVVDASDRSSAYFALRAALCSRREDLPLFDEAFGSLFEQALPARPELPPELEGVASLALPRVAVPRPGLLPLEGAEPLPAAWSDAALLREKDFAAYSDDERRIARRIMASLARRGPARGRDPCRAAPRSPG